MHYICLIILLNQWYLKIQVLSDKNIMNHITVIFFNSILQRKTVIIDELDVSSNEEHGTF